MTKMLNHIEDLLNERNIQEARHVVRVLHSIICSEYWKNLLTADVERLIKLIYLGIRKSSRNFRYTMLRRGFEMCLRKILEVVSSKVIKELVKIMITLTLNTDLSDIRMMDFGNSLEFATIRLKSIKVSEAIEPEVFEFLLQNMNSRSVSKSYFACTILSRLLDHNDNFDEFIEPKIFHHNTSYSIKISEFIDEDKKFLNFYKWVSIPKSF